MHFDGYRTGTSVTDFTAPLDQSVWMASGFAFRVEPEKNLICTQVSESKQIFCRQELNQNEAASSRHFLDPEKIGDLGRDDFLYYFVVWQTVSAPISFSLLYK